MPQTIATAAQMYWVQMGQRKAAPRAIRTPKSIDPPAKISDVINCVMPIIDLNTLPLFNNLRL